MHGDIGVGKPERVHRLQVPWEALSLRGAAVVDAVVRLDPRVDGRGAALPMVLMPSRDLGADHTFLRMTWAASLVHKLLLGLWRQHVGGVGLMMGGLVSVDLKVPFSHGSKSSLLFAAEKTQADVLEAPECFPSQPSAVPRIYKRV